MFCRLFSDLCGKYLYCLKSMYYHLKMHLGSSDWVCEQCGEKFYSPKGLKYHNCRAEKSGKITEKPNLTYDQRYCRYCDSKFSSMDEVQTHPCPYKDPVDENRIKCRICSISIVKKIFSRHMDRHKGLSYICEICGKHLATERNLKCELILKRL